MNRKKPIPKGARWPRKLVYSFGLTLLFFVISKCVVIYVEPACFPIRHVSFDADSSRIDLNHAKTVIIPFIKGFFSTDVSQIKQELLKNPMLGQVSIRRLWKDTLSITLSEQQWVARWGDHHGVTRQGTIVLVPTPSVLNPSLPLFEGSPDEVAQLLTHYYAFSNLLGPLQLSIDRLSLNPRQSWTLTLSNGVKLFLGRQEVLQHLLNFKLAYPRLKKIHGDRMDVMDLRYPNGISVHLR